MRKFLYLLIDLLLLYGHCLIFQAFIYLLYNMNCNCVNFKGKAIIMVFLNCVAIALIVYEVGYLGLLLLNNLEVIPSEFKLFTRTEIFVSYFIYNLNHFK